MRVIALFMHVFLLAMGSTSTGVHGQSIVAVEYTFNNATKRTRSTGTGDPSPSSSLDGTLFPESDNGVSFVEDEGRDKTAAAKFTGKGCIQVPDSIDVNMLPLKSSRMISLDFYWDGTNKDKSKAEVLYAEGDEDAGFNIYLNRIKDAGDEGKAKLRMAVWERSNGGNSDDEWAGKAKVIQTDKNKIEGKTWYQVEMVLDENLGTISGYLDDKKFGEEVVDFFPIKFRSGANGVGGMKEGTVIFNSGDGKDPDEYTSSKNGLYFRGLIDNFRLRNEGRLETLPDVRYAFDYNLITKKPWENTGAGDPSPSSSLDGLTIQAEGRSGHGIGFKGIGAGFTGKGCMKIPNSVDVNERSVSNRTISLDFKWGGRIDSDATDRQILFEEGGKNDGINIHLADIRHRNAKLVMAVWESNKSAFLTMRIKKDVWYHAALVLDRFGSTNDGTLTGYLDGVEIGETEVDFFSIEKHRSKNCLGGMLDESRTLNNAGKRLTERGGDGGFYFNGHIDNFMLFNEVVRPIVPTITQSILVVEYTFDNKNRRYRNTGDGGPSLNGDPKPTDIHGIQFDSLGEAYFTEGGCIQVPDSVHVNLPVEGVSDRTISLNFKWNGTTRQDSEPQIIFEEGGKANGINIYVDPNKERTAELVMAVWETNGGVLVAAFVNTTIEAGEWYSLLLVLNQVGDSANGTLSGYLDGNQFGEETVDFFPINRHGGDNCLGGMKGDTRVFSTDGSAASEAKAGDGLYLQGYVDDFRLYNSVELGSVATLQDLPDELTASPYPTMPSTSLVPSNSPSKSPAFAPIGIHTKAPTPLQTQSPSTSPTFTPTPMPSVPPTPHPTPSPSITPTTDAPFSVEPSFPPSTDPSPGPSSSLPSEPPTELPLEQATVDGTWTNITYDDFENSGWGSFGSSRIFGGRIDVSWSSQDYIHQGMGAIFIRWIYGSFSNAQDYTVTGYSNLRVHFWYYPVNTDRFFLEYSSNSGSSWTVVKAFVRGQDFFDSAAQSFHEGIVDFDATNTSYARTDKARIRFRNDPKGISNYVYFDDVSFQGFQSSA